jgi:Fe-S oxidoreductase
LKSLEVELKEMKRCKSNGLCCGAGGAQMWKEEEAGTKRVNLERTEEALKTGAEIIAVNCPFCLTMMEDGLKEKDKQDQVKVYDLAELLNR